MADSLQIKSMKPWHETLIEYMIANPRASLAETAFYFNTSISWLSIVKHSDAFKEVWALRRKEHFSTVSAGVAERLTGLTEVTINALTEKIEEEHIKREISVATLTSVGDMALKALGFGNKPGSNINVTTQQNNVFIDKDTLARARETRAKLTVIEGEIKS